MNVKRTPAGVFRMLFFSIILYALSACSTANDNLSFQQVENGIYVYESLHDTTETDTDLEIESEKDDNGIDEVEFIILPNGTKVDTRIDGDIVDLVFRHFEAIENGDIVAFRETLQGQDGASINWHIGLIYDYFWDIVFEGYEDEMFHEGDIWAGLTEFGWHRVFVEKFPPISRNTGMFIREMRISDDSLKVAIIDDKQEESFYVIGLLFDLGWPGIEWHNPIASWVND